MLRRRIGLVQAVSLNMAMMVGIGPFITIPDFVRTMHGPHALVGWVLGALVALADGLVWSELAAAFPGSGGTYHFYDAIYGDSRLGRLLKFLFVWQFLFSGPLELASGAIGLGHYAAYFFEPLGRVAWRLPIGEAATWEVDRSQLLAIGIVAGVVALAYRRIEVAGRWMVVLWVGMLATVGSVIVAGLSGFDPKLAFDFPAGAFRPSPALATGLGGALAIAMYDYLGYYQVCYLGDEVAEPERTIPRSILIAAVAVATIYLTMNIGILGVIPWREVEQSKHIGSDLMMRRFGPTAATVLTGMILWTGTTGTFAGMLGYGRIPYAAARSGHFFRGLAKTHPRGDFPHRSLLLVGALTAAACLADLPTVISALISSRIVIQFVGQILTLFYVHSRPELDRRLRFRMALYPIPALVALAGWLFVFGTQDARIVAYGAGSLGLGVAVFAVWDRPAHAGPRGEGPA